MKDSGWVEQKQQRRTRFRLRAKQKSSLPFLKKTVACVNSMREAGMYVAQLGPVRARCVPAAVSQRLSRRAGRNAGEPDAFANDTAPQPKHQQRRAARAFRS